MDIIAPAVEYNIVDRELYRDLAVEKTKRRLESFGLKCCETLGKGTFGEVIKVENKRKSTKEAAKIVLNNVVRKSETDLWPNLHHKCILPLLGQLQFVGAPTTVFFSPVCQGDLLSKIEDDSFVQKKKSFRILKKYLRDILSGLEYVHGQNMNHLDVKLNNVLIKTDGRACICDFGCICGADTLVNRLVITLSFQEVRLIESLRLKQ